MNFLTLPIAFLAVPLLAPPLASAAAEGLGFPSHWRAKDMKVIFENQNVLDAHVRCILREGPCNLDGRTFRNALPIAIETACGVCTAEEKNIIRLATLAMHKRDPATLEKIKSIYDKDGKYSEAFIAFLTEDD